MFISDERISCADSRGGLSVETGWRVKITESMAVKAASAVGSSVLFALGSVGVGFALGHMLLQGIIINIMTKYMIMNERGTHISR